MGRERERESGEGGGRVRGWVMRGGGEREGGKAKSLGEAEREAGRESIAQGRHWRVGTKWWSGGAGVKVCHAD